MREQELKLEKVRKSCQTAKKITGALKILMIVSAILCFVGAGVLFGLKDKVNEVLVSQEQNQPGSIEINDMDFESGLLAFDIDVDEMKAEGTYAENFAIMCIAGGVVLIAMAVIFMLIQKIFIIIEEEESPFSEKVLNKIKKLFIAIAVIMGLEVGLGIGLFLALFFWCLYNIMDYGYALQKEIDETL